MSKDEGKYSPGLLRGGSLIDLWLSRSFASRDSRTSIVKSREFYSNRCRDEAGHDAELPARAVKLRDGDVAAVVTVLEINKTEGKTRKNAEPI